MNNLFATFDPQAMASLPLNWVSSVLVMGSLPLLYWVLSGRSLKLISSLVSNVGKEFAAILTPSSSSSLLLLPLSLFLVVLLNNVFGLIPFIYTSSAHLSFTIAFALPLWVGHMMFAALKTPNSVLAHLVPLGTPPILMPFMVLIEMISSCIRPLTLSVRLAANMIAGHLLLTLLGNNGTPWVSPALGALFGGLILLCTLECAVSMIQAYVFSVLSTLYVNEVNSPSLG